jgi:predicted phage terminase large subunit-like protein
VNGEIIKELDLKNKRVLISFESKSIGDTLAWVPYVVDFSKKHSDIILKLIEDKANGPAVIDMLHHIIGGIVPVEPEGSKEARAGAVTPIVESGNVYLPHPMLTGYEWVNDVIDQCAKFPKVTHDDDVDAMSQALYRFIYASNPEKQNKLPDTLPPDVRADLESDPAAMQMWLREHGMI